MSSCSPDDEGCITASTPPINMVDNYNWFELTVIGRFRVWQIMFLCLASVMVIVIILCCCIRFRIPRTKQEIEADYVRKKITRKFQKQLRCIQNAEMDDMDLKRALDRVRAEFKSDSESVAVSEALSAATLSSGGCNCNNERTPVVGLQDVFLAPPDSCDTTYMKGSDLQIGDGVPDVQPGLGAKFASLVENTLVMFRAKKQQTE